MSELNSCLDSFLRERGASIVGHADVSVLPKEVRFGLPVGISIGMAISPEIVAGISMGPTLEYLAEYDRLNSALRGAAEECARYLKEMGYRAEAMTSSVNIFDDATLSTVLPHKTVATLSGIGWIGKCALLVTEEFGSAIRLTTILTDAPLHTNEPVVRSHCGNCTECVNICPGHAPLGVEWLPGKVREAFFNASACNQTASAKSQNIAYEGTICGMCIAACPYTKRWIKKIM